MMVISGKCGKYSKIEGDGGEREEETKRKKEFMSKEGNVG